MNFQSLATTSMTNEVDLKSEKRKEKSRDASRLRRSQEMKIFTEMADLLPLPNSLISKLDKVSILRLTVAFLKVKRLLDKGNHELLSILNEYKCPLADACWPQALGGMLIILSSDGDIVYLTDNVIHQLGFKQVDLIGKSLYDYCHTDDHDELGKNLSLRSDGELARSFFLRLKSLAANETGNDNVKASTCNKVMNCSGRIVLAAASNARSNEEDDSSIDHFLVMSCDPIPHPFNLKMPLDNWTFITNHTLDMKYTYVDDKICNFFGFAPEDLKGSSVYQFHHPQDMESILNSYTTLFRKGQTETAPYRFFAKHGGYAWVQTQATIVSVYKSNQNFRSQAVVCVHTRLSEIEEADQILFISQREQSASAGVV